MTTSLPVAQPQPHSQRGIALIIVLLLMAVMSGLATGFALNGQVEVAMAGNEVYFAGARAAAEAGLNRAVQRIIADTTNDLLAGADQLTDIDPAAAVNDDNGSIAFLMASAGPYALDADGQYTYDIEILDDDDPALYSSPLSNAQKALMGEMVTDSHDVDDNDRLILRATGYGPKGTVVRLSRVLESIQNITTTPATSLNPAILVNGDLNVSGSINLQGDEGSVHANGDLTISGNAAVVSGDATSSGDFTHNESWHAGGAQGSGYPTVNIPDIEATDYSAHADYILTSGGVIQYGPSHPDVVAGTATVNAVCVCAGSGWTTSGGNWSVSGNTVMTGTFYAEGNVTISGSPGKKGAEIALSVIATGSISITGTPKLRPENDARLQFVTDGDLVIAGNVDLDDATAVEGQILVREQMSISGNPDFQGRILVQNVTTDGAAQSSVVATNSVSGNPTITYNGTLGAIEVPGTSTTDYTNNITGWMEQ